MELPLYYEGTDWNKTSEVTAEIISTRTSNYITAKNLMVMGTDSVERIMLAFKEVAQLAGYTDRVYTMLKIFKDVSRGKYIKQTTEDSIKRLQSRGEIKIGNDIQFDKVPIISPNGDVLVKELSITIKQGDHLLITGVKKI